ncbi:hypothetical protein ACIPVB_13835 [Microbacterium sp. NPDC090007]|uniref:hypothetical protein n=1 Tax=Microbacterium sp. NPDC090007 TaxID=3364204 RepID=UPI00382DB3B0
MPDPRSRRIDIGPFHLDAVPESARWRVVGREAVGRVGHQRDGADRAGDGADRAGDGADRAGDGADRAGGGAVEGAWSDWVAFAQRVLQVDELWRGLEARGDAWDEGLAAGRDAGAVNPYR